MKRSALLVVILVALSVSAGAAHAAVATFTDGIDLWLSSSDSPDAGNPNLGFGRTSGPSAVNYDALIRFTDMFGSNAGQIPLTSAINSATLYMWVDDVVGHNSAIYRMTSDWNASSTWSSIGGGIVPGTNSAAAPDYAWTGTEDDWQQRTFDLTTTVQDWSNGANNYGWGFTGDRNALVLALSLDYGTASDRPRLEVDYTEPVAVIPAPGAALLVGIGFGIWSRFGKRRRESGGLL